MKAYLGIKELNGYVVTQSGRCSPPRKIVTLSATEQNLPMIRMLLSPQGPDIRMTVCEFPDINFVLHRSRRQLSSQRLDR